MARPPAASRHIAVSMRRGPTMRLRNGIAAAGYGARPRARISPAAPGDGGGHAVMGHGRFQVDIRLGRLRQVRRRVASEVALVEDVAEVIVLAVVRTDWDWSAFRGVVRMADAERAHAPGAVEEI